MLKIFLLMYTNTPSPAFFVFFKKARAFFLSVFKYFLNAFPGGISDTRNGVLPPFLTYITTQQQWDPYLRQVNRRHDEFFFFCDEFFFFCDEFFFYDEFFSSLCFLLTCLFLVCLVLPIIYSIMRKLSINA